MPHNYIYYLTSYLLLISFALINLDFLHWKTFYQTFIGQTFVTIIISFKRKSFRLPALSYALLFYIILLASVVASTTEFLYKLGRTENHLDLFRHFVGLIPIVFFWESSRKDFQTRGIFRFILFSILLLSSISYNYTYFRFPELGFFLSVPILILFIEKESVFSERIKIFLVITFLFFLLHGFFTYTSISSLILYGNIFLGTIVLFAKFKLPWIYYFLLLSLNLLHVTFFEIQNLGEFNFFQKLSSPLLNTNRISNYYALLMVLPLYYFFLSFKKNRRLFFIAFSLSLLIIFALTINYSRGALISIGFVLIVYLSFLLKLRKAQIVLLGFAVIFHTLPLWIYILHKYGYNLLYLNDWSAGRIDFWNKFFEIFEKFTLAQKIFGVGIGEQNFFISYVDSKASKVVLDFLQETDGSFIHPHNLFLSILIYSGIFGVGIWLVFLFFIIKKTYLANKKSKIYFLSFFIFFVHNIFDSLENTLTLVVLLAHLMSFSFKRKNLFIDTVDNKSQFIKLSFLFLNAFLLVRLYHLHINYKTVTMQKHTWKDVRSCQFAYVPEISKVEEKNLPMISSSFLAFPELRRSQENLLYALKYYKNFPTEKSLELLEKTAKICNKHHFQAILCKFYEENKIAIIFDYYDHFKRLDEYPYNEVLRCFRN